MHFLDSPLNILKGDISSIWISDGVPTATFGNNKSGINVAKIKVEKEKLQWFYRHLHARVRDLWHRWPLRC